MPISAEFGMERKDQIALYFLGRVMVAQARERTVLPLNLQQQATYHSLHLPTPDIFPRVNTLLDEPNLPSLPLTINQMAQALNVPVRRVLPEAYNLTGYLGQIEGEDEVIASLSPNERRRFRRVDLVGSYYLPQVVWSRIRKASLLETLANRLTPIPKEVAA